MNGNTHRMGQLGRVIHPDQFEKANTAMANNQGVLATPPANIPAPKGATGNLFPGSEDDFGATTDNTALPGRRRLAGLPPSDEQRVVESLANEARDKTNRLTHELNRAARHHGEQAQITSDVWTDQSNRVTAGRLPRAAGPDIGANTKANPAGAPERSLED
jgi:hypothetical protein